MTINERVREFSFVNDTGESIPPFACMSVTGSTDDGDEMFYSIRKPNYDDEQRQDPATLVFNLGEWVVDGDNGRCTSGFPCQALIDEATAVAVGDVVGPVEGEWALGATGNAFVAKTRDATTPHDEGTAKTWMVEPNVAEVEVVKITSGTVDADGYYPGIVQRWDTATKTWIDGRTCRVKDANA